MWSLLGFGLGVTLWRTPFFCYMAEQHDHSASAIFSTSTELRTFYEFDRVYNRLPVAARDLVTVSNIGTTFPIDGQLTIRKTVSVTLTGSHELALDSSDSS